MRSKLYTVLYKVHCTLVCVLYTGMYTAVQIFNCNTQKQPAGPAASRPAGGRGQCLAEKGRGRWAASVPVTGAPSASADAALPGPSGSQGKIRPPGNQGQEAGGPCCLGRWRGDVIPGKRCYHASTPLLAPVFSKVNPLQWLHCHRSLCRSGCAPISSAALPSRDDVI